MSFYIFQAQKGKSNALFERLSSPQLNDQSLPRGSTRPEQLSFPGIIPISLSRGGGGRFMLYPGVGAVHHVLLFYFARGVGCYIMVLRLFIP